MKKIFLGSIFALLCFTLNAQQWNVGVGVGYIYNNFAMAKYKATGHHAFKAEAIFDYTLRSSCGQCSCSGFVLSSGLGFSEKGGTITGDDIGYASNIRKVKASPMYYLTIPFSVGYKFEVGKVAILPQIGVYAGIGVGGKGYVEGYAYPKNEPFRDEIVLFNAPEEGSPHGYYSHFNCFEYGATMAVNFTYDRFRLKAYYEHSLHEMNGSWGDPRHRSFGLSFIVMLKK